MTVSRAPTGRPYSRTMRRSVPLGLDVGVLLIPRAAPRADIGLALRAENPKLLPQTVPTLCDPPRLPDLCVSTTPPETQNRCEHTTPQNFRPSLPSLAKISVNQRSPKTKQLQRTLSRAVCCVAARLAIYLLAKKSARNWPRNLHHLSIADSVLSVSSCSKNIHPTSSPIHKHHQHFCPKNVSLNSLIQPILSHANPATPTFQDPNQNTTGQNYRILSQNMGPLQMGQNPDGGPRAANPQSPTPHFRHFVIRHSLPPSR